MLNNKNYFFQTLTHQENHSINEVIANISKIIESDKNTKSSLLKFLQKNQSMLCEQVSKIWVSDF